ncbi:hypothetical protein KDK_50500 [Dictyobacter kobayashii]|uniref:Membrane dipeptidase n=1 Tax=Dictyobacter kobayashii TaxID=2014872 RepID=A0A402AQG9_9CHLR|nr:hypothetical protein KDK_50500 [Dictyobacter kobayashii]
MAVFDGLPIIDGHNDTLLRLHSALSGQAGTEQGVGPDFFVESSEGHLDLPRARRGGLAGGFFAIFPRHPEQARLMNEHLVISEGAYEVRPLPAVDPAYAQQLTLAVAARLFRLEAAAQGQLKVVRSVAELQHCLQEGILAIILHFEGPRPLIPGWMRWRSFTRRACVRWAWSGAVPTPLVTVSPSVFPTRLMLDLA